MFILFQHIIVFYYVVDWFTGFATDNFLSIQYTGEHASTSPEYVLLGNVEIWLCDTFLSSYVVQWLNRFWWSAGQRSSTLNVVHNSRNDVIGLGFTYFLNRIQYMYTTYTTYRIECAGFRWRARRAASTLETQGRNETLIIYYGIIL